MSLSLIQIVAIALGALVALAVLFCLAMAAMSKAGRDNLAVIGVKIAGALADFFVRWVSEQHVEPIVTRRIKSARALQTRAVRSAGQ